MTDALANEIESEVAGSGSTPLDSILGGAGVSGQSASAPQESETISDAAPSHDDDSSLTVPLAALQRERARRRVSDQQLEQLEQEIEALKQQRWGLETEVPKAAAEQQVDVEQQQREQQAFAYNESFARFVAKNGKERVAEIDAALAQLPPDQQAHVLALVTQGEGDPMDRIVAYVSQIGALGPGFRPTTLQDALSGKVKTPQADTSEIDRRLADIDTRERSIEAAERRTRYLSSRTEFISEHGRQRFVELDAAATRFAQSGHPAAAQFADVVTRQDNPIGAVVEVLTHFGFWNPQEDAQQQQQVKPVMPSSFAKVRSVGARSGPTFSGPTPLKDIFARA